MAQSCFETFSEKISCNLKLKIFCIFLTEKLYYKLDTHCFDWCPDYDDGKIMTYSNHVPDKTSLISVYQCIKVCIFLHTLLCSISPQCFSIWFEWLHSASQALSHFCANWWSGPLTLPKPCLTPTAWGCIRSGLGKQTFISASGQENQ